MKLKQLAVCLILSPLLLLQGCSSDSAKDAQSIELKNLSVNVHDTTITLYQPLSSILNKKNWTMEEDAQTVSSKESERVYLKYKGEDAITISVYNAKEETIDIEDALIQQIDVDSYDLNTDQVGLPKDLKLGSATFADMLEAYGSPSAFSIYNDMMDVEYSSSKSYDMSEVFNFTFERGKLEAVSLYGSEEKTKAEDTTFDIKSIYGIEPLTIEDKEGPSFTELMKGELSIEGIQVTGNKTSASAFTDKGWSIEYINVYKEQSDLDLYLERKAVFLTVDKEMKEGEKPTDENKIRELSLYGGDKVSFTLPGEIYESAHVQDYLNAYGMPQRMNYDREGITLGYSDEIAGIRYSISFDKSGNINYIIVDFHNEY